MFRNSLEDEASSVLNNARASGTIPSRCVAWNFRYRKATCPNSKTTSKMEQTLERALAATCLAR
ncbi:hypothetical protein DPMN_049382 [Dreissena polymorpha]|uniref:Uncharacterized protein n=1 Tax=Dreissena polymorpha TaxID=45954 RepID=A0A9D4CG12_DREPO|nr:hypothetical protein DPMN_049382 [Dreissena polymorpha]